MARLLLLRTTHDLDKMRLLLDRGAPVDDFALLAAASVPGSRSALELLLAHGGNGRAVVPAYTAPSWPLRATATLRR